MWYIIIIIIIIEDNRFFSNGDLSLHINNFAQSCPEDNPAEML